MYGINYPFNEYVGSLRMKKLELTCRLEISGLLTTSSMQTSNSNVFSQSYHNLRIYRQTVEDVYYSFSDK